MTRLFLLALLVPAIVHADTTVRTPAARSGMSGGVATVTLLVNPVRAASSGAVEIGGQVRVDGGRAARSSRSLVEVRDRSGKVVFTDPHAFMFNAEHTIELGLGFSSSAGPSLPASLPAGDYVAVWTLEGVRSNEARFTIGPGDPPPLVLERTGDGRFVMHLFNTGADLIDLPGALESSTLIVDGKRYERSGIEWDGSSGLPHGRGWGSLLIPAEYGAPQPKHTLALQLGRWTSNTLTW